MALFDILKKSTKRVDEEGKERLISSPNQNTSLEYFAAPKLEPDLKTVSANDAIETAVNQESINSVKITSRSKIDWPKLEDTVKELITKKVQIFIDSSFIKSSIFTIFAKDWHANRVNSFVTRFFFVPSFEIKKLTSEESSQLINGDYRERPGDDFLSCFEKIVDQGLRWNIVLLTTNSAIGYMAQTAAKNVGLQLRWYGLDSSGKICLLNVRRQPKNVHCDNIKAHEKPFKITSELVTIKRVSNAATIIPTTGDNVGTANNGTEIQLKDALMTDHSSITYSTNDPKYFAKLYTANSLQLDIWENKAKRMLLEKVNILGVCWPVDILKDKFGRFIGILIPASKGVQLTRSVLNGMNGLSQYFTQWDKRDICTLASTILFKICKMHDLGLYFGCLNPASIYVNSAEDVYFVDTDSWQIEGYPAISRNQTFSPPELLKENKAQLLYTVDQENYQIALLTFMLMMPGKFPYAKSKGAAECDSIKNMAFPFSIGGGMRRSKDSERPSGIWRIVWDHLPYHMCDSFYNTFHSDGKYAKPGQRLNERAWLGMVKDFNVSLSTAEQKDSRSIFPRTFRCDGKRTFVKCDICGQEHPDFYFMHKIHIQKETINIWDRGYRVCLPCADDQSKNKDAYFKCECCGRVFFYTNRTGIIHKIGKADFDWENQKWCRNCKKRKVRCNHCGRDVPIYQMREFNDKLRNLKVNVCGDCFKEMIENAKHEREVWKNEVHSWKSCRNCGRRFSITNGEVEYYSKKGLNLPSHCPNCRNRHY